MGQPRVHKVKLELDFATTPTLSVRLWDPPSHTAFKDVTIFVSTSGQILPAGDLDWTLIYGGHWVGEPFASTSTHVGGRTIDSGTLTGGVEIASLIYEGTSILPPNNTTGSNNMFKYSTPVVLQIANDLATGFADPITLYITICSETVATNV